MKTQIVYLEPDDDHNSVRDKLSWTQAPRVIIVWPGRGRVLFRHLDLVMLQRYARKLGTQIGLVTLDPDVLHHAEVLQIPTFESLELQSEKAWRVRGKRKISKPISTADSSSLQSASNRTSKIPHQMNLVSRIALFSVGFLAIFVLALLLIPQAVITIEPETKDILKTYSIESDLEPSEIITNTHQLPARQVQSVLEGQLRLPTTGRAAQPDQPARGEVIFTNLTDQSLAIPAGTTVRTLDPAAPHFVTQARVNLDPEEGSHITAEVIASLPGLEGNVPAEAIQAIDGTLGLSASVSNPTQLTGGSLQIRSAVSPTDMARVRSELEDSLFDEAHQALLSLAQENENLIPGSIRVVETIEERFSNEIGDAADSLELILILEFEGLVYSPDQLHSAMNQVLVENLSKGENIQPGTLKILEIADIEYDDAGEETSINVTISARTYTVIDPSGIRKIVRGKKVSAALEDLNGTVPYEEVLSVDISPSWLRRFPFLDMQIQFRYPWEAGT
ncbi:MAG: baseplate J/gp47 family protein [Anaerolineales bacterium]